MNGTQQGRVVKTASNPTVIQDHPLLHFGVHSKSLTFMSRGDVWPLKNQHMMNHRIFGKVF